MHKAGKSVQFITVKIWKENQTCQKLVRRKTVRDINKQKLGLPSVHQIMHSERDLELRHQT